MMQPMKVVSIKTDAAMLRSGKAQARRKRLSFSAYVRALILADLQKGRKSKRVA